MSELPPTLWIVRRRNLPEYGVFPLREPAPFGLEAAFASREDAEEHLQRREHEEADSGNWEPLFALGDLRALMRQSDFDPPVFMDYLIDCGIPEPPTESDVKEERYAWRDWFAGMSRAQVSALYAGLHRFRFFQVIEVPFVVGEAGEEQWRSWDREPPREWERTSAYDFESDGMEYWPDPPYPQDMPSAPEQGDSIPF
jgi:hypothetical protein